MKKNHHLLANNKAVTPVVGAIILLSILIALIASIFFWGLPYIETMRQDTSTEYLTGQFTILQDYVTDSINSQTKNQQTFNLDFQRGSLTLEPIITHHFLLTTQNPDINMSLLNHTNDTLTIDFSNSTSPPNLSTLQIVQENLEENPTMLVEAPQKLIINTQFPEASQLQASIQENSIHFQWNQMKRPNTLFKYRLIGEEWTSYSTQTTIAYNNQPPQNYSFQLQIKNLSTNTTALYQINYSIHYPQTPCQITQNANSLILTIPDHTHASRYLITNQTNHTIACLTHITPSGFFAKNPTSQGTYTILYENNAVLQIKDDNTATVKIKPDVSTTQSLQFSFVCLNLTESTAKTYGGPGNIQLSLGFNRIKILSQNTIYHGKLYLYGGHSSSWIQYYNQTLGLLKHTEHQLIVPQQNQGIFHNQSHGLYKHSQTFR